MFGRRRLDAIKSEDVQQLKAHLEFKSPKTVNNALTVLNVLLKKAVEWEVIDRMPCTVKLLRVYKGRAAFHDFDGYERLVEVARSIDIRTLLVVPLGGDAGSRCGEIIGLEWADVDSREAAVMRASIGLEQAARDTKERTAALRAAHPKANRGTRRASASAQQTRAVPGRRLTLHTADRAEPDDLRGEAGEREEGRAHPPSHVLLASVMRGAPARAIQELVEHADLTMTQRYMHLSPAALGAAIRLLDEPRLGRGLGAIERQV
jgi:integrase